MSQRLQELCGYYSNRPSYEEVARLVERIAGEKLLSDQTIGQIVSAKALKSAQIVGSKCARSWGIGYIRAQNVSTKPIGILLQPKNCVIGV